MGLCSETREKSVHFRTNPDDICFASPESSDIVAHFFDWNLFAIVHIGDILVRTQGLAVHPDSN